MLWQGTGPRRAIRVEPGDLGYVYFDHMGMTGSLYQAPVAEIRSLIADPASIDAFLEASAWGPPVREVRPAGILGWLLKPSPVRVCEPDPDALPPSGRDASDDRPHCDLRALPQGLRPARVEHVEPVGGVDGTTP
jgi:hypothetical protein